MLDPRTDCRPDGIARIDEVRLGHRQLRFHSHSAASKKVDALIVCNAKDPRSERTAVVPSLKIAVGAKQGVLYDIFTVCDRSGHPGAIPVEPRAKGADGFEKCEISGFKLSGVFHITRQAAEFPSPLEWRRLLCYRTGVR